MPSLTLPATQPASAGRLRDVLGSEWVKFRSLPTARRLTAAAVILGTVAAAVLILSFPVTRGTALADAEAVDVLSASVLGLDVAAIVLIVLASWFVGIEFRTGAITEALVRLPRRSVVITAKAVVAAGVSAGAALLTAAAVTLVAVGFSTAVTGAPWSAALAEATAPDHVRLLLGSILMPVEFAVLAVFIAAAAGSLAAGLLGALGLIVASTLASWLPSALAVLVQPLLPLAAVHTISGAAEVGSAENLGVVPAVVVLAAWVAVGWAVAAWRLRRRDF